MNDPLKAITNLATQTGAPFPVNSRYHGIETGTLEIEGRPPITYLRRRIVPQADRFDLLFEYTVVQGDRLDNLAAKHIGDPELFWQIADANDALAPEELTETVGRTIRITQPAGIPG